jgi:calcineurin-like phosphoesterase family protein
MPAVFLVADTHFGHTGVCQFTRNDGVTKLRPWTDPNEMDEDMIKSIKSRTHHSGARKKIKMAKKNKNG